jgi:hypothetical protein
MPRIAPCLVIILFALSCKSKDQPATPPPAATDQPVQQGRYSADFGKALDVLMSAYDGLITAFAKADNTAVNDGGRLFQASLDSLSFNDLQKDTLVYRTAVQQRADTHTELQGLLGEVTLASKRQELNMVSQDLYDLLRTIRYDRRTLYFAECATALGDDRPGDWITPVGDTSAMVNPYVGGHVICAQVKDSLKGRP